MTANFENEYNWADDMQPQNLSRYQPDPVTNEEIESVPQYYMSLFPSPLQSSMDDGLLKRSDLNPVHCQQRPLNSGVIEDHKHNTILYPELTAIDTLHQSANNGYGSYNVLSHSLPHNPPDTYLEDKFLGLAGEELEGSEEHAGNFINNFEPHIYPTHINSLIYCSGLQPAGHEDSIYGVVPSSSEIQTTAVLDLSPTVSSVSKPSHHDEALPYSLSDAEVAKQQTKMNCSYVSSLTNNECILFKTNYSNALSIGPNVKHESTSNVTPDLPILSYEVHNSPSLLNSELDQSGLGFFQPAKRSSKPFKESFNPAPIYSDPGMDNRFKGFKAYNENLHVDDRFREFKADNDNIPSSEPPQYFDCGLPTVSSSSKSLKLVTAHEEPVDEYPTRFSSIEILHGKQDPVSSNLTNRYIAHAETFATQNENQKVLMDLTSKRDRVAPAAMSPPPHEGGRTSPTKPLKKSERIRKARVGAQRDRDKEAEEASTPVQKMPKARKKKPCVTCGVCRARFSEAHSLKVHLYGHTGVRPFECDTCGEGFTKSSCLALHRLKHTGEKPHECPVCRKAFRLASTLKSHALTHTGEKPFQCPQCQATFTQRSALKRHANIHADLKPFTCEVCGNSYRDRFYYKKHRASHDLKARHTCGECGEGFYSGKRLQVHRMRHNEGPTPYKCNKCSAEFVTQKAWKQHKRRTHERGEELRCQDCDATFKRKESFKAHKKVHTGDYLLKCDICQANFNNGGTLKKHIKRHDSRSSSAKKAGDPKASPSSVPCYKCQRSFSSARQRRTHRCYDKADEESGSSNGPSDEGGLPSPHTPEIEDPKEETPSPNFHPADLSTPEHPETAFSATDNFDMHSNEKGSVYDFHSRHVINPRKLTQDSGLCFGKKFDSRFCSHAQESSAVNLLSAALEV